MGVKIPSQEESKKEATAAAGVAQSLFTPLLAKKAENKKNNAQNFQTRYIRKINMEITYNYKTETPFVITIQFQYKNIK